MRAVVFEEPGRVAVREVEKPKLLHPTDVLVRVTMAGICGTDLHAIAGHFDGMTPGTVVGHEFVGDVVEVGSAVTNLRPGDHVMASDFTACGHCGRCAHGDHWQCSERTFFGTGAAFGAPLAGAQCEYVRVPHAETALHIVPRGCSDEAAILVGDNLATGWAAVERGGVSPGEIVAVIGGGAVGQLASLSAQAAGAGAVVVVEPAEQRRSVARSNGAIATTPENAQQLLDELTDGEGADVVIEAVGSGSVFSHTFDLVRRRGRIISVGAHSSAEWPIPIADCFKRELTIGFAIGDSIRLRPVLLRLIATGILDPTVIIDRRATFDNVIEAYDELRAQGNLKTVLVP